MKKFILLCGVGLCALGLNAQDSLATKYAATITSEELRDHLMELASDEYQGRDTGSEGQKKAAAYIAAYFDSLGIAPCVNGSYFQEFPLKRQRSAGSGFEMGSETYGFIESFFFFPGFEDGSYEIGDAVFAGYGIDAEGYSDYVGMNVEGKTVMVLSGEPKDKKGNFILSGNETPSDWFDNYRKKREAAEAKGVSRLIIIHENYDLYITRVRYFLENPGLSLDMEREERQDIIPTFFVSPKLADKILKPSNKNLSKIQAGIRKKRQPASFEFNSNGVFQAKLNKEYLTSENVLAFIEGTDLKDEVVVITAHYDHVGMKGEEIFNGADDDGSGTVSALEIAEAFMEAKKAGHGPRRSVLVMTVAGEEKGLLGSEWYSENPVFPLEKTVVDLNIDMIGRVDKKHEANPNYIYLIGADKLSSELHEISEQMNKDYTHLDLDYTFNDPNDPNRFYYRSDHYNFAKHNIPVIFYFSGVHEDYHGPGDTPDKIMYEKMVPIVRLVFHTAWELANRDQRIVVDKVNEFE